MDKSSILAKMRPIRGWLSDSEGLLLASLAASTRDRSPAPTIVEIGSYHGRSTVCLAAGLGGPPGRVYAIDPHEGHVGPPALDEGPTLETFRGNLHAAGALDVVEVVVARSADVRWDRPIHLLFIDGLHDAEPVADDFARLAPFVVPGGVVAVHDCSDHFPGVQALVADVLSSGRYVETGRAHSLVAMRKQPEAE